MEFRIDAALPATAARLWAIFFDVQRVALLIPGCEDVREVVPLKEFSAVMKQKVGPFKLEMATRILVESHVPMRQVVLVANGADRVTGTTIDVRLKVDLDERNEADPPVCRLGVEASMQVAGRLASLGYPIVKKRSEDLFAEFERRLRQELAGVGGADAPMQGESGAASSTASAPAPAPAPASAAVRAVAGGTPSARDGVAASSSPAGTPVAVPAAPAAKPGRVELVLVWPRVGFTVGAALVVAHAATSVGQAPWWWVVAPLLGVAAGLGRRGG